MDLIVPIYLTNQVGRIVNINDTKYDVLWITEEGSVGNLTLWKTYCPINLCLYTYINFEIERDYKYKWRIIQFSVKITSRYIGVIRLEHFCISLADSTMYNTNVNASKDIKILEGELVLFCLGNPSFMDSYDQAMAIRTHILAYGKVVNINDSTNEILIKWRNLKLRYKLNGSVFWECLDYVYVALDITDRNFNSVDLTVDKRNISIEGIILKDYGKVINKSGKTVTQCRFGTITPTDEEIVNLKVGDKVFVRCYIENYNRNYEITKIVKGVIEGSTILGEDDQIYTWKSKNVIGGMLLQSSDNVIFEVGIDKNVSNIELVDVLEVCPTLLGDETKLLVRNIDIHYKDKLTEKHTYKFLPKWNKEWLRFEVDNLEIIDTLGDTSIYEKDDSSDEQSEVNKSKNNIINNTIFFQGFNYLPNTYTKNVPTYNSMYNSYRTQSSYYNYNYVNEDNIW